MTKAACHGCCGTSDAIGLAKEGETSVKVFRKRQLLRLLQAWYKADPVAVQPLPSRRRLVLRAQDGLGCRIWRTSHCGSHTQQGTQGLHAGLHAAGAVVEP